MNLFKSKKARAQEIVVDLMGIVVELMVEDQFNVSAPEISAYLRNKKTSDISNAIDGCDSLLAQATAPTGMINPEVIVKVRVALGWELGRR